MTPGEKIKEARKNMGLSHEQLAEKLCVSRQAITKWESDRGIPDVTNLKALASLLDVSIDYLVELAERTMLVNITDEYIISCRMLSYPAERKFEVGSNIFTKSARKITAKK